jgi:hypothetical protein
MSCPILIMCYRRVDELQKVVESVQALNPSIIYFHLHAANTDEGQKDVEAVLDFIENYQGTNVLKYVPEPLGIYHGIKLALQWISEKEESFFVFEDDVPILPNAELEILPKMQELTESGFGVLKFGQENKKGIFWGWATTKKTVQVLLDFDFQKVEIEKAKKFLDEKSPNTHLLGIQHLYRNNRFMAWDDEFHFIINYLNIPVLHTDNECTVHIGAVSTRGANGADVPDNNRVVTFIDGVIQ